MRSGKATKQMAKHRLVPVAAAVDFCFCFLDFEEKVNHISYKYHIMMIVRLQFLFSYIRTLAFLVLFFIFNFLFLYDHHTNH